MVELFKLTILHNLLKDIFISSNRRGCGKVDNSEKIWLFELSLEYIGYSEFLSRVFWGRASGFFPQRSVEGIEDKRDKSVERQLNPWNDLVFSTGCSKTLLRILGIFERVIHISYKLSTVNGGLSTVLWINPPDLDQEGWAIFKESRKN